MMIEGRGEVVTHPVRVRLQDARTGCRSAKIVLVKRLARTFRHLRDLPAHVAVGAGDQWDDDSPKAERVLAEKTARDEVRRAEQYAAAASLPREYLFSRQHDGPIFAIRREGSRLQVEFGDMDPYYLADYAMGVIVDCLDPATAFHAALEIDGVTGVHFREADDDDRLSSCPPPYTFPVEWLSDGVSDEPGDRLWAMGYWF